ncbi:threonyl-tRNA synthetase [Microstroma glucosiphilum]|uniref:threonine--tRNA ligase n=1 Tax=Pseudomicrostroma glucosiphilum TaxID=1684307 RepID=A0A316UBD8_9BASI|nr:threonyl-tRNA synthetase [Pseudomicrostroma glucosiphilum]PWN22479.1 threonyl-tRNA synthetase [Pseudomicrostroma glucosiphilum]
MGSSVAHGSRTLRALTWTAGRRRSIPLRPRSTGLLEERLLPPLPSRPQAGVQGQRYFAYPPTQALWKSPISQYVSRNPSKGKEKEEKATEEAKIGLTLEISQQDLADFRTAGELLKARMPKAYPNFFAAIPKDGQDQLGLAISLSEPLPSDATAAIFVPFNSEHAAGRQAFWYTSAYLLGAALVQLHGADRCLLAGSPRLLESGAGGSGFSYEHLLRPPEHAPEPALTSYAESVEAVGRLVASQTLQPTPISTEDIAQLESIIAKMVSQNMPIRKEFVRKSEAIEFFKSNPFKIERVLAFPNDNVEVIRLGDSFVDIAPQGPVLPDTGAVKALKVTEWSTATFIPTDPSHPATSLPTSQHLQSLRGISFSNDKLLKAHLQAIEKAAASSHHAIGKAQHLFLTHQSSPGIPFMLPHGVRLARKMERVIRDLYDVHEYDEVISPQLYKKDLWVRSGHWQNYRDDMFSVEGFKEKDMREEELARKTSSERDGCCSAHSSSTAVDEAFGLKPMNCPGHCIIFASQPRTLKDLPIRFAEWSPLHRNESSGSLSGLTRVRRFHQDDAHVFCAQSQVASEISTMLHMLSEAYNVFGFPRFELVLSTRPANFIGSIEEWDRAEQGLKDALDGTGLKWELNEADGAFYGPKIDVRLVDIFGRKHQTATIQLDFQLPQRFDLSYEDVTEQPSGRARPVMIHRAILGSVERFMAILIESRGNHWPFWISPRQALVVPVTDTEELSAYARKVQRYLSLGISAESGGSSGAEVGPRPTQAFHVDVDRSTDTLGKRIRKAQVARYNFTLVVGEQEARNGTVRVRLRGGGEAGAEGGQQEDQGRVQRLKTAVGDAVEWKQDMGEWKLEGLRELFCKLDSWHL